MLRRARAMLAPDDPGAASAAQAALSTYRDLGAVTMFRGLERWLPEAEVQASVDRTPVGEA
jgi:hypothetical protein